MYSRQTLDGIELDKNDGDESGENGGHEPRRMFDSTSYLGKSQYKRYDHRTGAAKTARRLAYRRTKAYK